MDFRHVDNASFSFIKKLDDSLKFKSVILMHLAQDVSQFNLIFKFTSASI